MLAEVLARPFFQKRDIGGVTLADAAGALGKYLDTSESTVLADNEAVAFYLLNHAFGYLRASKHEQEPFTAGEQEFINLYMQRVTRIGVRAYYYLLIICTREARHCNGDLKDGGLLKDYLKSEYGVPLADLMAELFKSNGTSSVQLLRDTDLKVPYVRYLEALRDVFNKGVWSSAFGGKAWGLVTDCLLSFVTGKISLEIMTDTVWTLVHNGGPIFNKPYLYAGYTSELKQILDVQRSGQIPQLIWDYAQGVHYCTSGVSALASVYGQVLECLGTPDQLTGYLDWYKVDALGGLGDYATYKLKQQSKYGKSPYEEKISAMKKAKRVLADETAAKYAEKHFEVAPGLWVRKVGREELNVGGVC